MNGIGIYRWKDGRVYLGQYKNNDKHGYGVFKLPNGCLHFGHWKNGRGHGLGTFRKGKKTKYALWEDG